MANKVADKISLERINKLHPKIRQEVLDLYNEANNKLGKKVQLRIVQGFRTMEEQHKLFLQKPKVTNADAGQSYHNYGLAIDFCLLHATKEDGKFDEVSWDIKMDYDGDKQSDWLKVVDTFKSKGYVWGGDWSSFKDYPHLEKTFGKSVKQLRDMYVTEQCIILEGTKYVRL